MASNNNPRNGINNNGYDDQNYDYIVIPDEVINERYVLRRRLGRGSFGQVFLAYDKEHKRDIAIKIIKSKKAFTTQAQTELRLLSLINEHDPTDSNNIVRMLDQFIFRSHQCIVFEMLSYNLYELLRNTNFRGISLNLIRKFGRQILQSLAFLSSSVDIIHCDLKPENILLRHPHHSAIKIIDFGSSCQSSHRPYTYIQSRFYRAPEILFGLPYSHKIDIWSLACMLVEMHTGKPLFGGSDQNDQTCRIVGMLGMPPFSMLESASDTKLQSFERVVPPNPPVHPDCDMNYISWLPDRSACYVLKRTPRANGEVLLNRTLDAVIGVNTNGPHPDRRRDDGFHTREKYEEFYDFIMSMLKYDPETRPRPQDLLLHPFIVNQLPSDMAGTEEMSGEDGSSINRDKRNSESGHVYPVARGKNSGRKDGNAGDVVGAGDNESGHDDHGSSMQVDVPIASSSLKSRTDSATNAATASHVGTDSSSSAAYHLRSQGRQSSSASSSSVPVQSSVLTAAVTPKMSVVNEVAVDPYGFNFMDTSSSSSILMPATSSTKGSQQQRQQQRQQQQPLQQPLQQLQQQSLFVRQSPAHPLHSSTESSASASSASSRVDVNGRRVVGVGSGNGSKGNRGRQSSTARILQPSI